MYRHVQYRFPFCSISQSGSRGYLRYVVDAERLYPTSCLESPDMIFVRNIKCTKLQGIIAWCLSDQYILRHVATICHNELKQRHQQCIRMFVNSGKQQHGYGNMESCTQNIPPWVAGYHRKQSDKHKIPIIPWLRYVNLLTLKQQSQNLYNDINVDRFLGSPNSFINNYLLYCWSTSILVWRDWWYLTAHRST